MRGLLHVYLVINMYVFHLVFVYSLLSFTFLTQWKYVHVCFMLGLVTSFG